MVPVNVTDPRTLSIEMGLDGSIKGKGFLGGAIILPTGPSLLLGQFHAVHLHSPPSSRKGDRVGIRFRKIGYQSYYGCTRKYIAKCID